jgi:hypothetical protein
MNGRRDVPERREGGRGGRRISDKLKCPHCGCYQSKVLPRDIKQPENGYIRVRACEDCHSPYSTIEIIATRKM